MKKKSFNLFVGLLLIFGFVVSSYTIPYESKKIPAEHFDNLHRVSSDLYRSEQPSKKGMKELENLEIKSVVNLRNRRNDKCEAKGTQLTLRRVKINAWRMTEKDIVLALKEINQAEKPVVVHCLHGSDRTGAVVACYRMVFENWSRKQAVDEFLRPEFGYHDKWFPEILELVKTIDIQEMKKNVLD